MFVDFEKQLFDEGKPLPGDVPLVIRGNVSGKVSMVKLTLLKKPEKTVKPLYSARWVRPDDFVGNAFILPVNFRLHSGGAYTFVFEKYRLMSEAERQELNDILKTSAETYIFSSVEKINDRYYFKQSPLAPYHVLNAILEKGLANFENKIYERPESFSAIVENLLLMLTQTNVRKKSAPAAETYGESLLLELIRQVFNEIDLITNAYIYVLDERIVLSDVSTEKDPYLFAVNVGYAGAYYQGKKDKAEFLSGPYAGPQLCPGQARFLE